MKAPCGRSSEGLKHLPASLFSDTTRIWIPWAGKALCCGHWEKFKAWKGVRPLRCPKSATMAIFQRFSRALQRAARPTQNANMAVKSILLDDLEREKMFLRSRWTPLRSVSPRSGLHPRQARRCPHHFTGRCFHCFIIGRFLMASECIL